MTDAAEAERQRVGAIVALVETAAALGVRIDVEQAIASGVPVTTLVTMVLGDAVAARAGDEICDEVRDLLDQAART